MKRFVSVAAMVLAFGVVQARAGKPDCEPARCAVQSAISSNCPSCDDPTINHGRYVSCVAHEIKKLVASGAVPQNCKGKIVSCAAKSTCGKPGFVTCRVPISTCMINPLTGTGTCANDPTVACTADIDCGSTCHTKRSADKCPSPGVVGAGSCCATCGASPSGAFLN
jgi:hypothetical protein